MAAYFRSRAAGRRRVGGVLPDRPPAEAPGAVRGDPRLDARRHGPRRWLLEECYAVVGDGAETAALVLDQVPRSDAPPTDLHAWPPWVEDAHPAAAASSSPPSQQARVTQLVARADRWQRFILLKLLTGELRVGVSQTLVVRALAQAAGCRRRRSRRG